MRKIERIAIIGAGLMGHGIAEVFLRHPEYTVTLYDTVPSMLEAAPEKIRTIVQAIGGTLGSESTAAYWVIAGSSQRRGHRD